MADIPVERDPFLPQGAVSDSIVRVVYSSTDSETLRRINDRLEEREHISIYELARRDPRAAYAELDGLFRGQFVDPANQEWLVGSPEEDGETVHQGMVRYMAEHIAPNPDTEKFEVVVSVLQRRSLFKRITGDAYEEKEALRFRVGPRLLAM